jgi:2-iminobutanoate/2-iminopropanoate deaminase
LNAEIRQVTSVDAPRPAGAYSQAIVAGGLVFVSGQVPREPLTGIVPDGIAAQTRLALRNLNALLQAAGASLKDVVKITTYLADLTMFDEFNRTYAEFFVRPYPTRTTVGSQLRGVLVEVDAIAVIGDSRSSEGP